MKRLIILLTLLNFINVHANSKEIVELAKCVDGDTADFKINDEIVRVRFLAIDTPESVKPNTEAEAYGKEASDYTCNRLTNAKTIVLEYDDGCSKNDKFERVLAWVWVEDSLLEQELIDIGYAKVKYIYGKYSYTDLLYEHENIAKEKKFGIWSNYIPISYTVTFIDGNNINKVKVDENETIESYIPTKEGYKFIGWYYEDILWDFNTRITSNLTLTARYEKIANPLVIIIIIVVLLLLSLFKPRKKVKKNV